MKPFIVLNDIYLDSGCRETLLARLWGLYEHLCFEIGNQWVGGKVSDFKTGQASMVLGLWKEFQAQSHETDCDETTDRNITRRTEMPPH